MLVLVFLLLQKSKWGLSVRATASNELVAGMMGINTKMITAASWGIAGAFGAVGKPTQEQNVLWMEETLKQRNLVDLDWALANLNMSDEFTPYGKGDSTIHNITCPCAFTTGEKDIVVPPYMVMDNFNALGDLATLMPYTNCGHSPMVDCPDRLANDVLNFFA